MKSEALEYEAGQGRIGFSSILGVVCQEKAKSLFLLALTAGCDGEKEAGGGPLELVQLRVLRFIVAARFRAAAEKGQCSDDPCRTLQRGMDWIALKDSRTTEL